MKIEDVIKHFRWEADLESCHNEGRRLAYKACADYLEQHAAELAPPAPDANTTYDGQPAHLHVSGTTAPDAVPGARLPSPGDERVKIVIEYLHDEDRKPMAATVEELLADRNAKAERIAELEVEEVEKFICANCGREGQYFAFCEDEDICWPCGWELFIKPHITELKGMVQELEIALTYCVDIINYHLPEGKKKLGKVPDDMEFARNVLSRARAAEKEITLSEAHNIALDTLQQAERERKEIVEKETEDE